MTFETRRPHATLGALILCGACAAGPRVEVDRLESADWTRHETYALAPELAAADPAFGPSAREAAHSALESELRARGLEPAEDAGSADLLVAVGVTTQTRVEGGDVFVTPGPTHVHRRHRGVRTPVGDVPLGEDRVVVHHGDRIHSGPQFEVRSRTVVVDVFEADTNELVWRGTSRDPRSRERIDLEDLRKRVRAIVQRYP